MCYADIASPLRYPAGKTRLRRSVAPVIQEAKTAAARPFVLTLLNSMGKSSTLGKRKTTNRSHIMFKHALSIVAAGLACAPLLSSPAGAAPLNNVFTMVVSSGAASCLPKAKATVTIEPFGVVENMHVVATGLPAGAGFDFFIIQVPNAPFGLAWYMGDLDTDSTGTAVGDFVGRFSKETFIVAPGTAAAPVEFKGSPFPDASSNPETPPVQLYHLGIWFDSTSEATSAGCAGTATPFNGEHDAGIQVLNTSNFPVLAGPLIKIP